MRVPAIDVAKGLTMACVVVTHGRSLGEGILKTYWIDRSVPVFLVLFGLTSALWWRKGADRGRIARWYATRARRLLPPYWTVVISWWVLQRVASDAPVGSDQLAAALAGYAPSLRTSWFVTVALQIIVIFPLLASAVRSFGAQAASAAGLLVAAAVQYRLLPLRSALARLLPFDAAHAGFYAVWIFSPAYWWLCTAGWAISARLGSGRPDGVSIAVALAALGGLAWFHSTVPGSDLSARIALVAADVPLTVVVLAVSAALCAAPVVGRALSWIGRHSWEVYLGQMLVYNALQSAYERRGLDAEVWGPWVWTICLLGGGCAFAAMCEAFVPGRRRTDD